jgi:hypothetical protein
MYKCKYFGIKELVSKLVYDKFGDTCWQWFDADILQDLDTIRESWGKPIIINNWATGGNLSQCGLRTNADPLVKAKTIPYCSRHCFAKAFDLHDKAGSHQALWTHVQNLILNKKLKRFNGLEKFSSTPTWTHVEADNISSNILTF